MPPTCWRRCKIDGVLPVTERSIRLFLHILGASIWVGGQFSVAYLVPVLRAQGADVARLAARRFQQLAWAAYALLVATGIWHLLEISVGNQSGDYLSTLFAKLGLVALSGIVAAYHAVLTAPSVVEARDDREARRRKALSAATGALSLLFALGAAFLGVLLQG